MNRKQFILSSMGAGMFALLPDQASSTPSDQRADSSGGQSIPRKAIIPAALTSFDKDGKIDYQDFNRHISSLADVEGVTAIMVNGGSGLDKTLTREERRKLLGVALAAVDNRVPVLAAVRESDTIHKLAPLAKDAQKEGAQAMTIMPPSNEQGFNWDAAKMRFEEACSASDLPVVIYQTRYETDVLVRLAKTFPVVGVKEGSRDPSTFESNLRALRGLKRNIAVWSTHSRWLLADLAIGADGILSGMGSITADLHVALAEAVHRSDLNAARKINDQIFPLTQVFYRPGQNAHVRMMYALKKLGRQKHGFVRSPYEPLDAGERSRIDQALVRGGLL
ncbi:dihydrodipicolinate synthase family protein [Opitutia bacterium ISCC 51]|nr:dihydrodipicolinate synthase family protein [Opitutae bacterium ISCC 51]QXD27251.1 dihydrodipicolinate synthase family protein [Opitutae bacterium ISCC 52]